jgi:flagellar biosynthesis GTPase FlhF
MRQLMPPRVSSAAAREALNRRAAKSGRLLTNLPGFLPGFLATGVLVLAAVTCSTPLSAQTARSGGGNSGQNAQLVQQLQQLASERTSLQAEQAKLKKELDEVKKERDTLKAGQASGGQRARAETEAALARSARERESSEKELAQVKQRTQELIDKFRETAASLREVETDRATVKDAYAQQTHELQACVKSNNALYDLNDEVLTKFENQGFWSSMAKSEPFTKLKRTQLDNLIDGYRTRADDKKYEPGTPPPAPPPTTSR